ncbi:MAG: GAF domain-containing protein [Ignavibacteriaceae bacterium]|jgi:signal transduction histidine kinase|nr:GAF domain-containing protein [Ignavibacteriaceae bacterium]
MATQIKPLLLIKANKLFSNVSEKSYSFPFNVKDVIEFKEGDIIYKAGDSAEHIYLILEGGVKIKFSVPIEGQKIFVKAAADFFGEKEFLAMISRTSSAVAETNSTLYLLKRKELNNLITSNRTISNNLQGIEILTVSDEDTSNEPGDEYQNIAGDTFNFDSFSPSIDDNTPEEKTPVLDEDVSQDEPGISFDADKFTSTDNEIDFEGVVQKTFSETQEVEPVSQGESENESREFSISPSDAIKHEEEVPPLEEPLEKVPHVLEPIEDSFWGVSESSNNKTFIEEPTTEQKPLLSPEDSQSLFVQNENKKTTGLTVNQLQLIIDAAEKVNSNIKIDEVLRSIVEAATSLTSADRGTLYILDYDKGELWSKVLRGENIEEIKLKIGQGLAGWVAKTGEIINLPDAHQDERFDSNIDKMSGYKTKSMICYPIKNREGVIIGVLQLLNSAHGEFTQIDLDFLEALSVHVALALSNAELVHQLIKTDKLVSLGKLTNFILSDIKKPVLTIKQFAEHIKRKNVPDDVKQVMDLMIEQVGNVNEIIQSTLAYAEGKTFYRLKKRTLNAVMDEIVTKLAEYVEYRGVKLFKKFDRDVTVNVDKKELYQACYQIAKNACDAMPDGGKLFVSTLVEPNLVKISFKDNGIGIPESVLGKIFEPFMSQGKKEGMGLGLPIAENIIKKHNGTISVESELGEGAVFSISLPIEI